MRRSRKKKTIAKARVFWAVCSGICVVGGAFYVSSRPSIPFEVRKLHVRGLTTLHQLDWHELTGIQENSPLFGRWMDDVLDRVKSNPRVSQATIFRNATGEVVIQVSEHKAFALINLDRLYFINAEGKILDAARAQSSETQDFPVITGPWSGQRWTHEWTSRVREGVELLQLLYGAKISEKRISEIHFHETMGWLVNDIESEARIVLGFEDFDRRAHRLQKVLHEVQGSRSRVKEIDLNYSDRVVVKLRGTA